MIIDISKWNRIQSWAKVITAKPDLIILKATEGRTVTDSTFKNRASMLLSHPSIRKGFYHFASLNDPDVAKDARLEADFFLSTVQPYLEKDTLLILDIETNKSKLNKTQVGVWIDTFMHKIASSGQPVMLYSYTYFLKSNVPESCYVKYPLWIAAYVNRRKPILPPGNVNAVLWQYTSKGTVPGIIGNVDMNRILHE